MGSGAQADSALRATERRTVLPVGVLQRDLAVSKGKKITTIDLDASAVRPRSRERPLGHATIPMNEMPRVLPARIGKGLPYRRESVADRVSSDVARTPHVLPARGLEHAVLGHE